MKKSKKERIIKYKGNNFYLLFFIFIFLIGCGRKETVLRMGLTDLPSSFDPITSNMTSFVNRNVYEPLFRLENNAYQPVIANHWSMQQNLIIININTDIRFSDGSYLTIEDVSNSIKRGMRHPLASGRPPAEMLDSLVIKNKNELYLYYSHASNLLTYLSYLPIYKIGNDYLDLENLYERQPLGTGEYVLFEQHADKMIFKKNRYHRNNKNNSQCPDIIEVFIEPDIDKQYEMVLNNELDFLSQIPISAYQEIDYLEGINVEMQPSLVIFIMFFNFKDDALFPPLPLSRGNPIQNVDVRQAIAFAIDIESYIEEKLSGKAYPIIIPAMSSLRGYPNHLKYDRYDLEYSRSLMEKAGLSDGFELNLVVRDRPYHIEFGNFIKESLKEINIETNVHPLNQDDYTLSFTEHNTAHLFSFSQIHNTSINDSYRNYYNYFRRLGVDQSTSESFEAYVEIINSVHLMNEYDTRLPEMYEQLINFHLKEMYCIPFFEPYEVFLLRDDFTFNINNRYRFTDFKVVR